ncbi:MAG: EamA family transporter [Candidatus Micrarchaeota archaeon]
MVDFNVDWRIITLAAMVTLGVYNFLVKKFFAAKEDWRILIIPVFVAVLALTLYFVSSYKEVKFTQSTPLYALAILVVGALVVLLGTLAVASPDAPLNVVIPVIALSSVVTVILGIVFMGEALPLTRIVGIVLALISIYLISM